MANDTDIDVSHLTAGQQSALEQYTAVTAQDIKDAIPLLQRSQWNVQIAVSKFFDGEGPDPLAEALAAQDRHQHVPTQASRHENLQESLERTSTSSARRGGTNRERDRPEPAPRIVPQPQTPTHRPPLLLALLFAPFNVGYRAVSALFRTFVYIISFLPASIRPRALTTSLSSLTSSSSGRGGIGIGIGSAALAGGRRMLPPRDAAARFRREFEEEYGGGDGAASRIPFFEGGFAQALDLAKKDLKFLLVILVSPEHDDTAPFTRGTLLSDAVSSFLTDPRSDLVVWGGSVLDSEAYQVAAEYNCTKFPFSCLVCLTPRDLHHHNQTGTSGSSAARMSMSIVKRLAGPLPPAAYLAELRAAMAKYAPDLAAARAERAAHEVARSLRSEQDSAYERSLARDRERARRRREAEKRALERAAAAERGEQRRQQWRRWRAATVLPEPEPGAADPKAVVRLALKMPERFEKLAGPGGRVVRRFRADAAVEELYAFVECFDLLRQKEEEQQQRANNNTIDDEKEKVEDEDGDREPPEGYTHVYRFRIASPMPRVVYEPDEKDADGRPATLGQRIGRSGNLIVEELSDDDGEDGDGEDGEEDGGEE